MNTYPKYPAGHFNDSPNLDGIKPPKSTSHIGWICVWMQLAMVVVEIGLVIFGFATSKWLFDWMYPTLIAMAIDGLRHIVAIVGIYFGISNTYNSALNDNNTTKKSTSKFPLDFFVNLSLLLFPYAYILFQNVRAILTCLFPLAG